jgi:hypothetical protein
VERRPLARVVDEDILFRTVCGWGAFTAPSVFSVSVIAVPWLFVVGVEPAVLAGAKHPARTTAIMPDRNLVLESKPGGLFI